MARPAGFKIKHWTDDEVKKLREKMTYRGEMVRLAKDLGRTSSACWKKAQAIRLQQSGAQK